MFDMLNYHAYHAFMSRYFSVLVLLAVACSKEGQTSPPGAAAPAPVAVRTAPVTMKATPHWISATGSLKADRESQVAANVPGKVMGTAVERGQEVKAGQILVTLDSRSAALSARAAAAQSELARSQATLAAGECERAKKLFEAKTITQADFDRRMSECSATSSSLQAATANRDAAQKLLGDNSIRAPFSGVIGERFVEVGQYVRPDSPVVSLYTVDRLRLELTLPEGSISLVRTGLPIEFEVAAFPGVAFKGVLDRVSPQIRPLSRDLVVEAVIDNADRRLRPGMFASARLKLGEEQRPSVPVSALKKNGTDTRLYVVANGKTEERIVHVLGEYEGYAALAQGARADEKVVLEPGANVSDGANVEAK